MAPQTPPPQGHLAAWPSSRALLSWTASLVASRKPAAIQNPQPVPQLCLRHTSTPLSWPTSGPPHHFPSPLGPYLHLHLVARVICQIKHEHDYYESPLVNTLWILLRSETWAQLPQAALKPCSSWPGPAPWPHSLATCCCTPPAQGLLRVP